MNILLITGSCFCCFQSDFSDDTDIEPVDAGKGKATGRRSRDTTAIKKPPLPNFFQKSGKLTTY